MFVWIGMARDTAGRPAEGCEKIIHPLEYLRGPGLVLGASPVLQCQETEGAGDTSLSGVGDTVVRLVVLEDPVHELRLVEERLKEAKAVANGSGEIFHPFLRGRG